MNKAIQFNDLESTRKFISQNDLDIKKIIVTSDVFRIDDRSNNQFENPQRINIDWIYKLIAPVISKELGEHNLNKVYGDEGGFESLRWKLFSNLELPIEGTSWASVYDNVDFDLLDYILGESFKSSLILSYEISPSLINYFETRQIPYLDFSIHPVRFLPDYMFGIRTNVSEWEKKIKNVSLPEETIFDFARVSAARTSRVMRGKLPLQGSALFLGQLTVDASLIEDGIILDDEYLAECLIRLSSAYPKVYFKGHPHCKFQEKRKQIVSKIKNCEWIEVNVYDALACDNIDYVTAISSSGVIEAKYFNKRSSWMSNKKNIFDTSNENKYSVYWPVYELSMRADFWKYIFSASKNIKFKHEHPNPFDGAMKFNINMKWGR
jgi:hypothetical protein